MRCYIQLLDLDCESKKIVRSMCNDSRRLFNTALFYQRKHFRETLEATGKGGYLPMGKMDLLLKEKCPELYRRLHSQSAQAVLSKLDGAYKSFFALSKKKSSSNYDQPVRPPQYKKDKGLNAVTYPGQAIKVENGVARVPIAAVHKKRQSIMELLKPKSQRNQIIRFLNIQIPEFVAEKRLAELEIIPKGYGRYEAHFKYDEKGLAGSTKKACSNSSDSMDKPEVEGDASLSLDLGIDNFVAAVSSYGDAFLVNGKEIKSRNQFFNKRKTKLQSAIDQTKDIKKKRKIIAELKALLQKRQKYIRDFLHKVSHQVCIYAKKNGISQIIIGYNKDWKNGVRLGKVNNQKFLAIPHARLIGYISYKAKSHGIVVQKQEESYTSKCDALMLEEVKKQGSYSGKRVKRGLFRSGNSKVLNADINGAINIMRKGLKLESKGELHLIDAIAASGRVFRPWYLDLGYA